MRLKIILAIEIVTGNLSVFGLKNWSSLAFLESKSEPHMQKLFNILRLLCSNEKKHIYW